MNKGKEIGIPYNYLGGRMKSKTLAVMLIVCLFFNLGMSAPARSVVDTPDKIGDWIKDNITYVIDPEDIWQSAEETLRTEVGDCDDTAILAMQLLKKIGIKSQFVHFAWTKNEKTYGHAICIFKVNGKYNYIGTERYQACQADTIRDVCKYSQRRYAGHVNSKIWYLKIYKDKDLQTRIKEDLTKDRKTLRKRTRRIRIIK